MSGAKSMNNSNPKKTGKRKGIFQSYRKYSKELIEMAVEMVENKKISPANAEKRFGIPRQTIRNWVKKRVKIPEKEEEKVARLNTNGEIKRQKVQPEVELKYECAACKALFQFNSQMKYHIRRHHFNRLGYVPYADTQEVDQIWYENVVNSDAVVKITKLSENVLLIQKATGLTILPTEIISKEQEEVLDVRDIYPIDSKKDRNFFECCVCLKSFGKRELGKHFAKAHAHLVKKRCDTCQTKFKRAYNCARHVCPESIHKILKKKGNDEWAVVG